MEPTFDLGRFSPPVREWFTSTFAEPTPAQAQGWPAIAAGDHALLLAPTGSGKTLAAFLWAIDGLMTAPPPPDDERLRVLYVSPLRALAVDIDRNLRAPLRGIRLAAERRGETVHEPTVGVRTGDTPSAERRRMIRTPPDVLITTPESLYLLLTSQARETLRSVQSVIVDEIHAVAGRKRGSHLALSLERLEEEVRHGGLDEGQPSRPAPQRIALSATQRPLDEIARFLGGFSPPTGDGDGGDESWSTRPVTVVDAGTGTDLELEVIVPVADMGELGTLVEDDGGPTWADSGGGGAAGGPASVGSRRRKSIWPAIHPRLLDLIMDHRSTLVFVNARRLAERLAARLNELHAARVRRERLAGAGIDPDTIDLEAVRAGFQELDPEVVELVEASVDEPVRAHHGSLARKRRTEIEDQLKAGTLRGLVTTSSLELGIDMGAVDLVVQVSSPGAVSRGLQRIGRAGHRVGEPSRGRLFPKYRGDLLETAVVVGRMRDGAIESTRYPRNPLDVLAQQIVAMVAMEDWPVERLFRVVRRAAPFHELSRQVLHAVLDLLAGRYPSDEFSELRPRIVWDRVEGVVRGRSNAQMLAVTNPGTIPDRGLYGVFTPEGSRVGELDEEMVHETRPGETFILGATTWRIEDITHDRVVVTPAPGVPGRMPFWHGDGPGRPAELGEALGGFVRELADEAADDRDGAVDRLRRDHALDDWAADNLVSYLEEQQEATGALPTDRTLVVERFRDEIGDWRVCILSPWGMPVHAPWAMAIEQQLVEAGLDPEVLWADDGIVLRVQEAADGLSVDQLMVDPDEVERLVVDQLSGTALFTSVFREAAGRALLLPRRRPGQRTALWQQRQRAADLLQVASSYPSFPILLEATRECLRDVFDLPALEQLLRRIRGRDVRLHVVDTDTASPFASSLLFAWVGQYMYEYDAPLAERRAAALALDRDLLAELVGGDELRELLDAGALADLELQLQRLERDDAGDDRRASGPDGLHDLLLHLGDLTRGEVDARTDGDPAGWIRRLLDERRAIEIGVAGDRRLVAAEDAARYRDALGAALPPGLPQAFTEPVEDPLVDLVSRYARTHGPFLTRDVARRLGIPAPRVEAALRHLEREDRVVRGEFRPSGAEREWCDTGVLRRLRRRSLAALRREVEPVTRPALGRFLPGWHGAVDPRPGGADAVAEVVSQLQGAPIPASVLEADVLPARVDGYRSDHLDQLLASGEVVWIGTEPLGTNDGRVVLCFRDQAALLTPPGPADPPDGELHDAIRGHLAGGASFWPELFPAAGRSDQDAVLAALWDLVWAGEVTNDTYAPVRAMLSGPGSGRRRSRRGRPRPGRLKRVGPPAAAGRWSLTARLLEPRPSDTEIAAARGEQLLERHGVVTRESLAAEDIPGAFSAVYPVLKTMEEAGAVRRGYFVEGLGGAQFAAPGAVDRLRSLRGEPDDTTDPDDATVVTLAATDPAQPYGAALGWPESDGRPGRRAGAHVILVDGELALYVERGGRSLATFEATARSHAWVDALTGLVRRGRLRKLELTKIDGAGVHDHPLADALMEAGFVDEYRGLTYRG